MSEDEGYKRQCAKFFKIGTPFQADLGYSRMMINIPDFPRMDENIRECFKMFQNVRG